MPLHRSIGRAHRQSSKAVLAAAALRIEVSGSQRLILVSHREHLFLDLRISRKLGAGAELLCPLSKSLCSLLWRFHTDLSATTLRARASGITVACNFYSTDSWGRRVCGSASRTHL